MKEAAWLGRVWAPRGGEGLWGEDRGRIGRWAWKETEADWPHLVEALSSTAQHGGEDQGRRAAADDEGMKTQGVGKAA